MRETYCNPAAFSDGGKHTNPDPYILRWCGRYYCYATDEAGVKVSVSGDMVHWDYRGYAIAEKEYHHYWAPSVIYLNGVFYMYYSNIPLEEQDCHEEHLKLAVSENPLGPFVYRKTFFEKFSIDSHPLVWNGELYMFYSVNDWAGLESKAAGTCILVDRMLTPEEFAGEPAPVVLPSLSQEIYEKNRFGDGRDWYTIEGACPVIHGDKCWMLYSANAFESVYYFVGTAVAGIKENLREMVWKKYPNDYTWMPLLKKNRAVEGTGHNTVAKAPNLFEDWIVYHGRNVGEGLRQGEEQRDMRIDPLLYFGDRMFCPGPSYKERPVPGEGFYKSGELETEETVFFAEAKEFYRMEIWCSAVSSHAGAKYMLYPDYADEGNYVGLKMHSGTGKMSAVCCREGIEAELAAADIPKEYDFGVPHLICVERKKQEYKVTLDDDRKLAFRAELLPKTGRIGAGGCFTPVTIHSAAVAQGTELWGKDLFWLSEFYECSGAEIKDGALKSLKDTLCLAKRDGVSAAAESFQWQAVGEEHQISLYCGEEKLCSLTGKKEGMTFYCYRGGDKVYILTDGEAADKEKMEMTEVSGITVLSGKSAAKGKFRLRAEGFALTGYTAVC